MFDSTSRYYSLEVATMTTTASDGQPREVRYVRRRFVPSIDNTTTLVEHTVTEGDRIDNVSARYLGEPTQFWRICDANNVIQPNELTETIGSTIRIALPKL